MKLLVGDCLGMDTDLFDVTKGKRKANPRALAVCARCPIRLECLEQAMEEEHGKQIEERWYVRGGLTPGERYDLVRGTCADCGKPCGKRSSRCELCSKRNRAASSDKSQRIPEWERTCVSCGYVSTVPMSNGRTTCDVCSKRGAGNDGYYKSRGDLRIVA